MLFRSLFSFCTRMGPQRTPELRHIKTRGGYKITKRPFTELSLKNLKFEDKASKIAENTLTRKDEKRSSPWASPPLVAGDLQVQVALRYWRGALDLSLPAKNLCHRPGRSRRERITWQQRTAELRHRVRQASSGEVEDGPPYRPKMREATMAFACVA